MTDLIKCNNCNLHTEKGYNFCYHCGSSMLQTNHQITNIKSEFKQLFWKTFNASNFEELNNKIDQALSTVISSFNAQCVRITENANENNSILINNIHKLNEIIDKLKMNINILNNEIEELKNDRMDYGP